MIARTNRFPIGLAFCTMLLPGLAGLSARPVIPGPPGLSRPSGRLGTEAPVNFSGIWVLNTARSQNLGMMAALEDTLTISQTATEVVIQDRSSFQGQQSDRALHYDLTGKPTTNQGPMGDRNETIVRWADAKLVATWTSQGAVAGTTVVRTETRSVSADGKTMTVESVRGSNAPMVMVFDRK